MKDRKFEIGGVMIDDMVISLLENCYKFDYADILSHFYQLAMQTLQTPPNIIGPLKPPTGQTFVNKLTGKTFRVTKKVSTPQEVDCSIWVIRGFYPNTGIPFKMTVWFSDKEWGDISGAKVVMGSFPEKNKWTHVPCRQVRQYVEEVAEKTILDQPIDETKKPKRFKKKRTYRCMSPEGLELQKIKEAK
jgi:hypothetical protein